MIQRCREDGLFFVIFAVFEGFFSTLFSGFLGSAGCESVFFAVDTVHALDDKEDNKGDNEEFDNVLDEIAVGDDGGIIAAEEVWHN